LDETTGNAGHFRLSPINFELKSAQSYFQEQKQAYLGAVKQELSSVIASRADKIDDDAVYDVALFQPYSKAWYEFHINDAIDCVSRLLPQSETKAGLRAPRDFESSIGSIALVEEAVKLGRLIEQYYWKFFIEKAAIRGEKISKAAKSGGHRHAYILKQDHDRWQTAARAVRQKHPAFSESAVASIVKQKLTLAQSPKHIARVLARTK
jgi:hypothetical protein